MNILFAYHKLLMINKVVTICYKMSRKPISTTIINKPYVSSGIIFSPLLFNKPFNK